MSTRQILSFNQKAAILEEFSRPNFSKEKILKDYQISKTCFYKILKEKDSILRVSSEKSISTFKKFGKSKTDALEIKLSQWIKSKNDKGLILRFLDLGFLSLSYGQFLLSRKTSICLTFCHFWEKYWFWGFCQPIGVINFLQKSRVKFLLFFYAIHYI